MKKILSVFLCIIIISSVGILPALGAGEAATRVIATIDEGRRTVIVSWKNPTVSNITEAKLCISGTDVEVSGTVEKNIRTDNGYMCSVTMWNEYASGKAYDVVITSGSVTSVTPVTAVFNRHIPGVKAPAAEAAGDQFWVDPIYLPDGKEFAHWNALVGDRFNADPVVPSSAGVFIDTAERYEGNASLRVVANFNGVFGWRFFAVRIKLGDLNLTEGASYVFSTWAKATFVDSLLFNVAGASAGQPFGTTTPYQWKQITHTFTYTGAGNVIEFSCNSETEIWFDNMTIVRAGDPSATNLFPSGDFESYIQAPPANDYEISPFILHKDGRMLSAIEEGEVKVSTTVTNNKLYTGFNPKYFAVLYNGNETLSIKGVDGTIPLGRTGLTIPFTVPAIEPEDDYRVEVFMWDSLSGMNSLSAAGSFD